MQLKYQIWVRDNPKTEYLVPGFYSNYLSQPDNKEYFEYNIKDYFNSEFVEKDETAINNLVRLAPFFSKEIRKNINAKDCTYLVPDDADDFSSIQRALRTSMNIAFHNAFPLPRSIAYVFFEAKKGMFNVNDDIYIYDKYENRTVITRIHVNEDKRLLSLNPQTRGLVFERYPCEVIEAGKEHNKSVVKAITFTISGNITGGVEYLEELQAITPDIPLWKDNLPLLYMEAEINDEEQKFYLVGEDTKPIQPKRGVARNIEIKNTFVLGAGRDYYEFPLVQGSKDKKQKYFAYMTDKAFPLQKDVQCKLYLTYTYGDPLPYKLIFKPNDGSTEFDAIKVQWETKSHKIKELAAPEFYKEEDWDFVLQKKLKEGTVVDEMIRTLKVVACIRQKGWKTYSVKWINRAETLGKLESFSNEEILFFPKSINKGKGRKIETGDTISCTLRKSDKLDEFSGRYPYIAFDGQLGNKTPDKSELTRYIACILEAFNQGRVLSQIQTTRNLNGMRTIVEEINTLGQDIIESYDFPPVIKKETAVLMCAMHEHSSEFLHNYLLEIMNATLKDVNSNDSLVHNRRIIDGMGFAIGNCNQDWQKELMDKAVLLCKNKNPTLVNFGIEILGSALWRTRNCVYMLNAEQIQILITSLVKNIDFFVTNYYLNDDIHLQLLEDPESSKDDWRKRKTLLRSIELILALYRLRDKNAPNYKEAERFVADDNPEIQKLKNTFKPLKEFLRFDRAQKDKIFCGKKYKNLKTRIVFEINDENRDKTLPDFMYVLEKYTKGETSGIKILKISE